MSLISKMKDLKKVVLKVFKHEKDLSFLYLFFDQIFSLNKGEDRQ